MNKIKKLVCMLLAVCFSVAAFPFTFASATPTNIAIQDASNYPFEFYLDPISNRFTINTLESAPITYYVTSFEEATVEVERGPGALYSGAVTIPNKVEHDGVEYTVTSIGSNAFIYHEKLTTITLPDTIKTIESGAFSCCKFDKIICNGSSPATLGTGVFDYTYENFEVFIPVETTNAYVSAGWPKDKLLEVGLYITNVDQLQNGDKIKITLYDMRMVTPKANALSSAAYFTKEYDTEDVHYFYTVEFSEDDDSIYLHPDGKSGMYLCGVNPKIGFDSFVNKSATTKSKIKFEQVGDTSKVYMYFTEGKASRSGDYLQVFDNGDIDLVKSDTDEINDRTAVCVQKI